jgi:hypothetical protein
LPWHLAGEVALETPGSWTPTALAGDLVTGAEMFTAASAADPVLRARVGDRTLRVHLVGGTVVRAEGPGRPGASRRPFFVVRSDRRPARLVALLDLRGAVTSVVVGPERIEVTAGDRTTTLRLAAAAVRVAGPDGEVALGGPIPAPPVHKPLLAPRRIPVEGEALRVDAVPALDGTLDGFDTGSPLELADEGHYYRSEEPYPGPDDFAVNAFVNWDAGHVYLAVEVAKPEVIVRPAGAPRLDYDNDPDDIHSDGIQVYYRVGELGQARAFLIRPAADGTILARSIPGDPAMPVELTGRSWIGERGYSITVALPCPELDQVGRSTRLGFDLCVNEMRPGRERRAGQLAWGGGDGWIYLRGDGRDPAQWGTLELIG